MKKYVIKIMIRKKISWRYKSKFCGYKTNPTIRNSPRKICKEKKYEKLQK